LMSRYRSLKPRIVSLIQSVHMWSTCKAAKYWSDLVNWSLSNMRFGRFARVICVSYPSCQLEELRDI
jgi:hypothetical protein